MANIALTTLDEHFARAWEAMGDQRQRAARRRHGKPNYRLTRYADDFVVCVAGDRRHAEALIADTERAIAPLGLTLSREKTRVAHIDEGIDFLGWRIQRHRGSDGRRYVYTYPSKRALASVKTKVKTITQTDHNQTLDQLIHRLNPVLRGWCAYFRPGVSSRTFNYLRAYTWQRVVRWLRRKHDKANWRWLRRRYLPGWWPTDGETELFNPGSVSTTRYRYRGRRIPTPWESGYLPQAEPGISLDRLQRRLIA
jgi:RNA-directed DNA polymerase